jgi:hypothetical protein
MERILFKPKKIEIPTNLVLIPQFWDTEYFQHLKDKANGTLELLKSDLLLFDDYTVIVGFLGYPNILTILEFIKDVKEKEIYFLGTAGSMNEEIDEPTALNVEAIYSTALLSYFSEWKSFRMKLFDSNNLRKAKGVTVDIVQRETPSWLKEQVHLGMEFVEMEIFPLRAYMEKPFHAVVVTTDILRESGVEVFPDKKQLKEEFVKSYELIVETISSTESG